MAAQYLQRVTEFGAETARMAAELERWHRDDGLDVVRLSPGFVYGPGGLLASAFVEQA